MTFELEFNLIVQVKELDFNTLDAMQVIVQTCTIMHMLITVMDFTMTV